MPALLDHPSHSVVKLLIASDSGTGKTGGLASLVDAGFNVRVLDFDEGVSTIRGYVRDKSKLANVAYIPLKDKLEMMGNKFGIKKALAFPTAMEVIEEKPQLWGLKDSPGPITRWTANDVLVIDTFTMMGRAALYYVMAMNNASAKNPELQHYGIAMENLEKFIGQITSEAVPCNVIINTHLTTVEGSARLYPEALGSKLGPKIARYFDNMITIDRVGGKLVYKTQQSGGFNCKTSIPMEPSYPIETGLASIFKKLKDG